MTIAQLIEERLSTGLHPVNLTVVDESHLHAGHGGARPEGETHFRIDVVSEAFAGKGRVERHRMVNACLGEAFSRGLHAIAIRARTPDE